MSKRKVTLEHRANLVAEPGEELAATTIDVRGRLVALSIARDDKDIVFESDIQPGWATFPKARTDRPYPSLVRIYEEDEVGLVKLEPGSLAFPHVELLGDDE